MILFLIFFSTYWITGFIFFLIDYFGNDYLPFYYNKYKINKMNKNEVINNYIKCIKIVMLNHIIIQLPSLYILELYIDNNISLYYNIINFIFSMILNALLFTFFHVMFHNKFYFIHKLHHEFKNTISLNSEYNTLTEEIISWTISTWFPLLLFKLNYIFTIIYIIFNSLYGIIEHAGYKIIYLENDIKRHDLHHKKFSVNYSGIEIIDKILGTNLN